MSAEYTAVCCDCGRSYAVQPVDMGKRRPCHCGYISLVPRLDEFQQNPVQQTYPSVLPKVVAHIEDGLLPGVEDCQGCGDRPAREVSVLVQCERSREETVGGTGVWAILFAILLGMVGGFYILLRPDHGVTSYYGRDTDIRVPVCLCEPCQRRLAVLRLWPVIGVLGGGAAVAAVVGWLLGWWWAILPVVVALAAAGLITHRLQRQRVEGGRALLKAVPDYAELLQAYRFAEVRVPRVQANGW
jgi:hypothetical protein